MSHLCSCSSVSAPSASSFPFSPPCKVLLPRCSCQTQSGRNGVRGAIKRYAASRKPSRGHSCTLGSSKTLSQVRWKETRSCLDLWPGPAGAPLSSGCRKQGVLCLMWVCWSGMMHGIFLMYLHTLDLRETCRCQRTEMKNTKHSGHNSKPQHVNTTFSQWKEWHW